MAMATVLIFAYVPYVKNCICGRAKRVKQVGGMGRCERFHLPQTPFLGYSLLLTMKNVLGHPRSD